MAEVTQSDFARICGVAASVISRKIKNNTLVRNAAGLLDTENPVNARYAARRRLKNNAAALEAADPASPAEDKRPIPQPVDFTQMSDREISEHAGLPQRLLGLTLRQLVKEFKGLPGMQDYVRMLKDMTVTDEREQKVRERRLQLVEKDFITARQIQYLDSLMRQLLEYPESAVDEIIALVQAEGNAARLDVSRKLEAGISKIIKNSKDELVKELSGLRSKYQDDDRLGEKIKEAIAEATENQ